MYINFSKNVFCTFLSQCVYKLEMLYLIRNIEGGKKFPGHPTREKLSGSWAYYFLGVYIPLGPPEHTFFRMNDSPDIPNTHSLKMQT